MTRTRTSRPTALVALVFALPLVGLAACGDDEGAAPDQFCEDARQLRTDVGDLADIDVLTDREAFDAQLQTISDDIDALKESADAAARDDLDQLDEALSTARDHFDATVDDPNLNDAGDALSSLGDAVSAGGAAVSTLLDAC